MRNSNAVESTSPLSSVPISLYRELCDELRHKTQELEAADHQNQRLVVQNQQLRQELQQLVQRVMQTQQAVTQMTTELPSQAAIVSPVGPIGPTHTKTESLTTRLWNQTNTFTQDLQGWKMAVMMGLIVLSAFGAGFLIMRPFMAKQQQVPPLSPQPLQPQQMPKR